MDPYVLITPLLGFAVITAAVPFAFVWLWRQQRELAALWWAAAYAGNVTRVVVSAFLPLLTPDAYRLLHVMLLLVTVTSLLVGVFIYARRAVPWRAVACGWGLATASVAIALGLELDITSFALGPSVIAAFGLVAAAWFLPTAAAEGRVGAHRAAAVGLLLFAVYTAAMPLWVDPAGAPPLRFPFGQVALLSIAISLIMALLGRKLAHAEAANRRADAAAQRLAESERRLRDYAEASSDLFWEQGPDLRFTYVSGRVQEILGVPPEDIVGCNGRALMEQFAFAPEMLGAHIAAIKAREPFRDVICSFARPGGGRGYLSLSGRPAFDATGAFLGYRGTATESTARIERDQEAADAIAQLRDFAESTADWFWERDAALRYTYVSPSVERIFGAPSSHFIGHVAFDLGPEDVGGPDLQELVAAFRDRRPFRELLGYRRSAAGKLIYTRLSGRPTFDANGAFTGYRGTGRDVTSEIESARAAGAANERLAAAIDKLDEAFALYDADDRLVSCNETYRRHFAEVGGLLEAGVRYEDLLRAAVACEMRGRSAAEREQHIQARLERHRNPSGPFDWHPVGKDWVRVSETRLADGSTAVILAYVGTIKRREEEVAVKTRMLQAMFDTIEEGIGVFDAEMRLVAANARYGELVGVPAALTQPGTPVIDVLEYQARAGDLGRRDPHRMAKEMRESAHRGEAERRAYWHANGRYIEFKRAPMPGGGFLALFSDQTEIKLAELRFRDFADASSDWFWEQDENLRFIYYSPRDKQGWWKDGGDDRFLGKTRRESMPDAMGAEAWRAHDADLAARRRFRDVRLRVIDRDGKPRHLSVSGKPVFTADGQFRGYRGTTTDISVQVEAERRANLAQSRFAAAIDGLTEAFALYDRDDRLVIFNDAYRALMRPVGALLAPGARFEDLLRAHMGSGQLHLDAAGSEEWFERRMALHRSAGDALDIPLSSGGWVQVREQRMADGGTITIVTDITANKQRERELAAKSALLQTTLEYMGEGIAVTDGAVRLVAWNDRFVELLDLPPELVSRGSSLEDLTRWQVAHGEFGTRTAEDVLQSHLDLGNKRLHYTRVRPNGRIIEVRRNPMPGGGVVSIYNDVTERQTGEDALREAKESAEIANRTKSEFLANMSHELRTPLNAIIGFSEIITDELFGPIGSSRYTEYARDILASGRHLLNLINDILDVSKAEAGKIELHDEPVAIADTIASALRLVTPRARENGLVLDTVTADDAIVLNADALRLKQVILNLLSNAVKFTPPGGRVTVRTGILHDGNFMLTVTDTGIGIAEADLAVVLTPFGQVDSKLSRKYEGTGLGLPLSQGLVRLHGGELTIASKPGEGTTVKIVLPASRVLFPEAAQPAELPLRRAATGD